MPVESLFEVNVHLLRMTLSEDRESDTYQHASALFQYFVSDYMESRFRDFSDDEREIAIQSFKNVSYLSGKIIKFRLYDASQRRQKIKDAERAFAGDDLGEHRKGGKVIEENREAESSNAHQNILDVANFFTIAFRLVDPLWAYHWILEKVLQHRVRGSKPTYGIKTMLSKHTGKSNATISRSEENYLELMKENTTILGREDRPDWIQQVLDATEEEQPREDGLPFIDLLTYFFKALGGDITGNYSMPCAQYIKRLKALLFPKGAPDDKRIALFTGAFKQLVSIPSLLNKNDLNTNDLRDLSEWLQSVGATNPRETLAAILSETVEQQPLQDATDLTEQDVEDEPMEMTEKQLKRVTTINHMHEKLDEKKAVLSKYVFGQLIQGASINPVNRDGALPEIFANLSGRKDLSPQNSIPVADIGDVNQSVVETALQHWSNARDQGSHPPEECLFDCYPTSEEIQVASDSIRNWRKNQDSNWDDQSYPHRLIMVTAWTKSLETLTELIRGVPKC
jgi:hypothetical protein